MQINPVSVDYVYGGGSSDQDFASLHRAIQKEQFFSWVFHEIIAEVADKVGDVRCTTAFILRRKRYLVLSLVGEEDFQTAPITYQVVSNSCDGNGR